MLVSHLVFENNIFFFFGGDKGEKLRYDVSLYFAEVFGYALTWPRVSLSLSDSHFGGIR